METTSPNPIDTTSPSNATTATASSTIPRVIGLYGIPSSGKSYLMTKLKQSLGETEFAYFEGSDVIDAVTDGGLAAFKRLDIHEQNRIRTLAIGRIRATCGQSGKTGIVTGHFMFWDDEETISDEVVRVCTRADLDTYTHILYVNASVDVDVTAKQRVEDTKRQRSNVSIEHLRRWQATEIQELRGLCREHGILFATIYPNLESKLTSLIRDFHIHNESHNNSVAEERFDKILAPNYDALQTVLFFDADKTLAVSDASTDFWKTIHETKGKEDPLRELFSSPLKYSYTAFQQGMLSYEEVTNDDEFDEICEKVAVRTQLYPQMSSLLRQAGNYNHVCPVIVTCGLRRVWEKIVAKAGLADVVKVVGGSRLDDGFVVTPTRVHGAYTWAFGDSPVDLRMLIAAHKAIVVVGEEKGRSKSMDHELLIAMVSSGLQARQVLLPNESSSPRLDVAELPVVNIADKSFLDSLYHATDSNAAKLLEPRAAKLGFNPGKLSRILLDLKHF
ncbi:hypothetical protein BJY00DRAFT_304530 [Aspergillus carlsbadensis]|nr:hypothetical protein BJY00DRAFT_304530 [Aspergillus carlsbadensis]